MIFGLDDGDKDSDGFSCSSSGEWQSDQSLQSSSSERSDEKFDESEKNTFLEPGSGMLDVPGWLKSLRLHKYQYLFATLSYEEMLELDEDKLEENNVTKGIQKKTYYITIDYSTSRKILDFHRNKAKIKFIL